jgi:hypothetical protein
MNSPGASTKGSLPLIPGGTDILKSFHVFFSTNSIAHYMHARVRKFDFVTRKTHTDPRIEFNVVSDITIMELVPETTSHTKEAVQHKPSCSTRAGGRTDVTKLIIAFRNSANAPKTEALFYKKEHFPLGLYL